MTLRTTQKLKTALLDRLDDQYSFIVELALRNIPQIESRLSGDIEFAYLQKWRDALPHRDDLRQLIADNSDDGLSAWQLAPFAGVFTPQERWEILRHDE
ncbi:MAG: hypothetical protein LBL23_04370 [Coriobacteriales bacterium]|nr:hypothetical protein [Coriobacteriales bacterium]